MSPKFTTIVKAGLLVGTLDILSACLYYFIATGGKSVVNILKYIASGIYGKEAFAGGSGMIVTGLVLHYCIAFSFTILFFWLYPKLNSPTKHPLLIGIGYGVLIWSVMNLVIVPLSSIGKFPADIVGAAINMLILIVCIGIPLSLMATRFYNGQSSKPAIS